MNYYARFINLPHRTDRLRNMQIELSRINLQAERIEGLYPRDYTGDMTKVQTMLNRTPGALGCHFSQVRIMKEALMFGQHAIVMEDDLHFCEDFNKRFEYIENWCSNNDWDIFWLGSSFHCNPAFWHRHGGSGMPPNCSSELGHDAHTTSDPRIMRTYGAFVTFAYLVNVSSIEKVIALLDQYLPESIGIDWLMVKIQPQLKTFCFVPGLVRQIDNQSDIGIGETRWSGFLQLNGSYENSAYVFQEKMEQFNPGTFNWAECR